MPGELTFNDYPFLKELDLEEENLGVYNGKWVGSGNFLDAINPTTGNPIARYIFQNNNHNIRAFNTKTTQHFHGAINYVNFVLFF